MIINYETNKFLTENHQIEIDDTKNVFLRGKNPYDALDTYFGIWTTKKRIVIVTLVSWRTISYKSYLNKNLSTENDIREFLNHVKDVKIISREEFKVQMDNVREILKL